jgi:hypothetical protein
MYSTNSSSSITLPVAAISLARDRILLTYSITDKYPSWVVVSWSQVLTLHTLIYDENIPSISFHAAPAVSLVAICGRTSFDTDANKKPRTCWSEANHSSYIGFDSSLSLFVPSISYNGGLIAPVMCPTRQAPRSTAII